MTDDLEDLAVAVGVMCPPPRIWPSVSDLAAGIAMAVLSGVAVISGTALWGMLG